MSPGTRRRQRRRARRPTARRRSRCDDRRGERDVGGERERSTDDREDRGVLTDSGSRRQGDRAAVTRVPPPQLRQPQRTDEGVAPGEPAEREHGRARQVPATQVPQRGEGVGHVHEQREPLPATPLCGGFGEVAGAEGDRATGEDPRQVGQFRAGFDTERPASADGAARLAAPSTIRPMASPSRAGSRSAAVSWVRMPRGCRPPGAGSTTSRVTDRPYAVLHPSDGRDGVASGLAHSPIECAATARPFLSSHRTPPGRTR